MKHLIPYLVIALLVVSLALPTQALATPATKTIPTFSIVSVAVDSTVTIVTYNFPAHDSFDVLMNTIGTHGIGGIKVSTISSGSGGSFTATFPIPDELKGRYQIAIRLESNTGSGYYAYNWFYNNPAGGHGGPHPGSVPYDIPTFAITGVEKNLNVTITTNNFPSNDSFDVLMNYMGTRGKNGIKVATVASGAGGTLTFTFNIPAPLKGQYQIAIRLQSNTGSGYYAYNWFYNNTAGGSGGLPPGYLGFPTFSISAVVRNNTVTIVTNNLPPSDKFDVLMGPIGSRGINGYYVTNIDSGTGGVQTLTFNIPPELKGSHQISIRLKSTTGTGFYAYNWFYNNTTP